MCKLPDGVRRDGLKAAPTRKGDMLPVPVQRDFESRADDASAPLSTLKHLSIWLDSENVQTPLSSQTG